MDFEVPPHIQDMRERVLEFIETKIYPWEKEGFEYDEKQFPLCSEDHPYIRRLQQEVKDMGLWAGHLPKEAGGMGLSLLEYGLVNEIIGRSYFAPRVFGCNAPDSGNAEILWHFGTEEQKEKCFWPLQRGEIRSFFSMTEPDTSGSDPRQLQTTAVREGDEWVINGRKWYSTNANGAAFGIVVAVTDPNTSTYRRQSMILVPAETPGVRLVRPISVMGHTTGGGHWEVAYENVRVPVENTLGQEGDGFMIAQSRLGPGRIHHCMRWLGQAQRGFDLMCQYALEREAFGSPLADKQTVQNWIADSAAEIQAARLMVLNAAWMIDHVGQREARVEISMIKFFVAKVMMDVLDRAIQVHGGLGVSDDTPLAFMWRQGRAARIYDGPDEVHRMVVSREMLKKWGAK
ncbi:MAG: acyl-CoA dehydrogenase family protein [Anaerolineae bacterium]|nr:acyl-CoA dehydrogenase family protein [Anaerolineae bacterium]